MAKLAISFHVENESWKTRLRPYTKTIQETLDIALAATKLKGNLEIAVVLADDAFIQNLNSQYRGKDKPTNVLSFPSENGEGELGDIILAIETIDREAKDQGKTFRNHSKHLLVHGFLHLLGHDHMTDKEALEMESLEIKILKKQNVKNPYL